jgi:UDP:flavonoid glycosyltransferase YjiC (YdhE family)
VLLTGWGGLRPGDLPAGVLHLEGAPHEWLFPRCAAVVHHAGAGTTAAALRAGVPAVPVPVFADQPFWAARLHAAGVAPPPLPLPDLTAERLAERIAAVVGDPRLRARAAELGEKVRAEPGTAEAVQIIEEHVARRAAAGA